MRVYTLHAPPAPPASVPITAARGPVGAAARGLLLDGADRPAALVLWHRMWLVAALWTAGSVIAGLALPEPLLPWVAAAAQILIGFHARDLRRWTLARRGLVEQGVVVARTFDAAVARLAVLRPDLARAALATGGVG